MRAPWRSRSKTRGIGSRRLGDWWLVSSVAPPRAACSASRPLRAPMPSASSASKGSSSSHSSACRHSASRASATRRRWPWLSVRTGAWRLPRTPSRCSAASSAASSGRSPRAAGQEAQRLDRREVVLERILVADVDAGRGARPARPAAAARRRTRTSPAIGVASPASRRSRLVLPRPLRPRSQTTAPGSSASSRCSNSARSPRWPARSQACSTQAVDGGGGVGSAVTGGLCIVSRGLRVIRRLGPATRAQRPAARRCRDPRTAAQCSGAPQPFRTRGASAIRPRADLGQSGRGLL